MSVRAVAIALISVTEVSVAQRTPPQPVPTPRALGPVIGRTQRTFGSVAQLLTVRGAVFVQDPVSRQLWMFDPALTSGRVVLDSASGLGRENYYGSQVGTQIGLFGTFSAAKADGTMHRFRGDSITYQSRVQSGPTDVSFSPEMLIVGNSGRVGRITPMPTIAGVPCFMGEVENSGFYMCQVDLPLTRDPDVDMGDSVMTRMRGDSATLLSVNFATWEVDSVPVRITVPQRTQLVVRDKATSRAHSTGEYPVIAAFDRWATFRDGTLAIVRGADYHLEIVDVRGAVTKGARAPYDWRRVTDADGDRLLDSLAAATRLADSLQRRRIDSLAARLPRDSTDVLRRLQMRVSAATSYAPRDQWSSYWPPITMTVNGPNSSATIMIDEDDRVWVNERQPPGGDTITVFGIFDRKARFLERVKVAPGELVRGFGAGGVVYLTTVDGGRTTVIARRFKAFSTPAPQ